MDEKWLCGFPRTQSNIHARPVPPPVGGQKKTPGVHARGEGGRGLANRSRVGRQVEGPRLGRRPVRARCGGVCYSPSTPPASFADSAAFAAALALSAMTLAASLPIRSAWVTPVFLSTPAGEAGSRRRAISWSVV